MKSRNKSMVDSFFAIFGLYRIKKAEAVVKKTRKPRKPRALGFKFDLQPDTAASSTEASPLT